MLYCGSAELSRTNRDTLPDCIPVRTDTAAFFGAARAAIAPPAAETMVIAAAKARAQPARRIFVPIPINLFSLMGYIIKGICGKANQLMARGLAFGPLIYFSLTNLRAKGYIRPHIWKIKR